MSPDGPLVVKFTPPNAEPIIMLTVSLEGEVVFGRPLTDAESRSLSIVENHYEIVGRVLLLLVSEVAKLRQEVRALRR